MVTNVIMFGVILGGAIVNTCGFLAMWKLALRARQVDDEAEGEDLQKRNIRARLGLNLKFTP